MKGMSENFGLDQRAVQARLAAHGIKPTRQRILIAGFLFERAQHVTAEEVLHGVNSTQERVSKATVYNTLNLFVRHGLVRDVLVDPERTFYDSNTEPHHHLYWEDDGTLVDVAANALQVRGTPALPEHAEIVATEVIVRVRHRAR
jgi:Fur family iron response transcriptional regulator